MVVERAGADADADPEAGSGPLLAVGALWLWSLRPWGELVVGAMLVMLVLEGVGVATDQWFGVRADPDTAFASAGAVPLSAGGFQFDTASIIDRCHRLGLRIDYWTVNDAATAARLCDLGADGIMTDDPARIAPVFERYLK